MIEKIEKDIKDVYDLVVEGELDSLNVILLLKQLENKAKEYKTKLEDIAIEELEKYGKEGAKINGHRLTLKRSAGRWDFKHIEAIREAENTLKRLKEKHKTAYNQQINDITAIGKGGEVIDPAKYKEGKTIIMISHDKT